MIMPKIINFSAGPSILPKTVFEQASQAVLDLNGSGLSILEISHRSNYFEPILHEAMALVKELLGLPEDYEVLFLAGGASTQFFMTVMNLLPEGKKAAYVDTGVWASKAITEAKMLGTIEVIASSKDKNYSYIPKGYTIPTDCEYLHLTSNNTIYGTQYQSFPESPIPVVCDMSSDIFSKPIVAKNFGLIYAGAQKNLGPAGVTLVIIRKDMLG
jgi:phosphoserine aminotransferase